MYIYPPRLAVSAVPCPDWAVDPPAWASRRCPAPTAAPRPPPRQAAWAASRVVVPAAAAACPALSPRGSQAGGPCRLQDLKAIPSRAFQVPNYRSPPLNTAINPLKTMKGDDFPCSKTVHLQSEPLALYVRGDFVMPGWRGASGMHVAALDAFPGNNPFYIEPLKLQIASRNWLRQREMHRHALFRTSPSLPPS